MTTKYRAAQEPVTKKMAIFARDAGHLPFNEHTEFPVATFMVQASNPPFDAQKLAENMADLLSHRTPIHQLSSGGEQIFYSRTDESIILRTRNGGVSVPAITITISKSSASDVGREMLGRMDQDFMKRVCDTITPDTAPAASPPPSGPSGMHI